MLVLNLMIAASSTLGIALAAPPPPDVPQSMHPVESGFHQMYDLQFDKAHQTFEAWEREHPKDPLGPASNAAAYLYAEFDRLRILQSELFVDDSIFRHRPKVAADPQVKQAFDQELAKADQIANDVLARSPQDADTLFAKTLTLGLRADYMSLIEHRDLDALKVIKTGREDAEKLLAIDPSYYDAYLAIGVENYLLSLKPAPVRWFLEWQGAQADHERGIEDLKLTAEKGHLLSPYARLLLGVAALRDKDRAKARQILSDLTREFPHNRLYHEELARLQ